MATTNLKAIALEQGIDYKTLRRRMAADWNLPDAIECGRIERDAKSWDTRTAKKWGEVQYVCSDCAEAAESRRGMPAGWSNPRRKQYLCPGCVLTRVRVYFHRKEWKARSGR